MPVVETAAGPHATRAHRQEILGKADLYVIITASLCARPWQEVVREVLRAGTPMIQLREKGLSDREYLERARWTAAEAHRHGALCVINDRADIAWLAGADGVHLGAEDLSIASARRIVGIDMLIGVSTRSAEQAESLARLGPDYVAVGPMFASPTKPGLPPVGVSALQEVASRVHVPVVAIGGITADNVAQIRGAGRAIVCVCSAVIAAGDPYAAAKALRAPGFRRGA